MQITAVSYAVSADLLVYSLRFNESVGFDRVAFDTPKWSHMEFDPVSFAIEVLLEDGGGWAEKAASGIFVDSDGMTHFLREPQRIPEQRGAEVSVSLREHSYYFLGDLATLLFVPFAFAIVVCSLLGKYEWGRPLTILLQLLSCLQLLAAGCFRVSMGIGVAAGVLQIVRGLAGFGGAVLVYRFESRILEGLAFLSLLKLSEVLLQISVFNDHTEALVENPPLPAFIVPVLCAFLLWQKHKIKRKALATIKGDVKLYNTVWDELMADAGQSAARFAPRCHACHSHDITGRRRTRRVQAHLPRAGGPQAGTPRASTAPGIPHRRADCGAGGRDDVVVSAHGVVVAAQGDRHAQQELHGSLGPQAAPRALAAPP